MALSRPEFALFDCGELEDPADIILDAASAAGLDVDQAREKEPDELITDTEREISVPYDEWSLAFTFHTSDEDNPGYPLVGVRLNRSFNPSAFDDATAHREWVQTVIDLLVRTATALDAAYTPIYSLGEQASAIVPNDLPIGTSVDLMPPLGIFSTTVVGEFGGLDAMYDDPWYVTKLGSGHILVVESPSPWSDTGWEPAKDDFLDRADGGV